MNILLWRYAPEVSWLWWNVLGCLVALGIGHLGGGKQKQAGDRTRSGREAVRLAAMIIVLLAWLTLGLGVS